MIIKQAKKPRFILVFVILILMIAFVFVFGVIPTGMLIGIPGYTVKIGVILNSDIWGDIYTQFKTNCAFTGIQKAVEDINQQGGINGTAIEIISGYDQNDPEVAKATANNFYDAGAVVIIPFKFNENLINLSKEKKFILSTPFYSGGNLDKMDYEKRFIPSSPSYTGTDLFNSSYLFLYRDPLMVPTLTMADVASKKLGITKVSIIHTDNLGSIISKNLFKERFESLGGTVLREYNFSFGVTDNYSYIINDLKENEPEALFFPNHETHLESNYSINLEHVNDILKEIKSSGLNITLLFKTIENPSKYGNIADFAGDAAEGIIFVSYSLEMHSNKYRETIMLPYSRTTCFKEAYESVLIPAIAMEKCGEDADCISSELHNSEFESITGRVSFNEDGFIIRPYVLKTIKGGSYETMYEYNILGNMQ